MTLPNYARLTWPDKDPHETLIYSIAWGDLLGDDPITAVVWTTPAGLTEGAKVQTGYVTSVELSGGTLGQTYGVECKVTTTAGLVYQRTPQLEIAVR